MAKKWKLLLMQTTNMQMCRIVITIASSRVTVRMRWSTCLQITYGYLLTWWLGSKYKEDGVEVSVTISVGLSYFLLAADVSIWRAEKPQIQSAPSPPMRIWVISLKSLRRDLSALRQKSFSCSWNWTRETRDPQTGSVIGRRRRVPWIRTADLPALPQYPPAEEHPIRP